MGKQAGSLTPLLSLTLFLAAAAVASPPLLASSSSFSFSCYSSLKSNISSFSYFPLIVVVVVVAAWSCSRELARAYTMEYGKTENVRRVVVAVVVFSTATKKRPKKRMERHERFWR